MPARAPEYSPPEKSEVQQLTSRWTPMKYHPEQYRLWTSPCRFRVVPAGRRSGKTEIAKRYLVEQAIACTRPDAWFVCAAPTINQAIRIYWKDLKKMIPEWLISRIWEDTLTIRLITGTEISVMGMEKPERVEGRPLDGIILDEYADMKPKVWTNHVRAALSTPGRPGWAWFIGVPEGRNHYYRLYMKARSGKSKHWDGFHWVSADILDPEEIAEAKKDLDKLTFDQEYNASFLNFEGRVYYSFDREIHAKERLSKYYDPEAPLNLCLDFNVKPGVAVITQDVWYTGRNKRVDKDVETTLVLGEIWIPDNSNTKRICEKFVQDWGDHRGEVLCYGDATGGARGTAKIDGSDWDIVKRILRPEFDDRLGFRYRRQNPKEKVRVNAVNSRLMTADETVRCLVDPVACPHLVEDMEGVTFLEGTAGEIDKDADPMLTHISDALGYFIEKKHPLAAQTVTSNEY